MADVAVFGNTTAASVDLLNGFARMFLGAVEGDVAVVLMDGASQLRVEGAPGDSPFVFPPKRCSLVYW